MRMRGLFAAALIWLSLFTSMASARTWTDASGTFKIEAALIRTSADGASVTLRRSDGEEITLKIDSLCEADRKFLQAQLQPGGARGPEKNPFLTHKERVAVAPSAKVSHRRALLIGVNEYKHFRKLQYCGSDVQALGKRLTAAGFDRDKVVVIHDEATRSLQPDKEKIVNQVTLFFDGASRDDLLFLSFSGHGVRIGGKSYLVPYEGEMPESLSDAERLKTLISLDWLYEKLQACPAETKIFLVDACQNRPFSGDQRSARSNVAAESIAQSLQSAPKSVLLMTACAPGEVSHESSDLKHGVYTYYLLEALEGRADYNHDGVVSLREANLYASGKTEQFVRTNFSETQRPSFRGEMQGDVPLAECLRMDRITVPDDIEKVEVAMRRIAEGGTITIKPGAYRFSEPLEITCEMTVVGSTGDAKDVVLEGGGCTAFSMKAARARVQGISIRNTGTDKPAVGVGEGRLELSKCDVASEKGSAVWAVGGTAELVLTHCSIHDAGRYGVYVVMNAKAVLENCDIFANGLAGVCAMAGGAPALKNCKLRDQKKVGYFADGGGTGNIDTCEIVRSGLAGIEIANSGNPTVKSSKINGCEGSGIVVHSNGRGVFEDCDVSGNKLNGITVQGRGNPSVKGCKFHDGNQVGILVNEGGTGQFAACEVWRNALGGVFVGDGGNPVLKGCKIRGERSTGIFVTKKGVGNFEDCDVYETTLAAMAVADGGDPLVRNCRFYNARSGLDVTDNGKGNFQNCHMYGNSFSGICILDGGNPAIKKCEIHDCKGPGILVASNGKGDIEECDIYANAFPGVQVSDRGNPSVRGCKIHDGHATGVLVNDKGEGVFENCHVFGNASANMTVFDGGNPAARKCSVYDGKKGGLFVDKTGFGTFEDCEMFRNTFAGVEVCDNGNPTLRRCKMYDNQSAGVLCSETGFGTFEECEMFRNAFAGVEVRDNSNPTVQRCRIHSGRRSGIHIHENGHGIFEANVIQRNAGGAWEIEDDAGDYRRVGNSPNR